MIAAGLCKGDNFGVLLKFFLQKILESILVFQKPYFEIDISQN